MGHEEVLTSGFLLLVRQPAAVHWMPASWQEHTEAAAAKSEIDEMLKIAKKHGFSCRSPTAVLNMIGHTIASRMTQRQGNSVYQMFAATVPFCPLEVLLTSCGEASDGPDSTSWALNDAESMYMLSIFLQGQSEFCCAGLTRAFRAKSQPVIRVVATLMPPFEICQRNLKSGAEVAYLNGMYALTTEHGEVHWPKANDRREVAVDPETERWVRQQVLTDVLEMANRGDPISPGWWRQLGEEEKALEVEAALNAPRVPTRRAPRPVREPRHGMV